MYRDVVESLGQWEAFGPWSHADVDSDPDPDAIIRAAIDAIDIETDADCSFYTLDLS